MRRARGALSRLFCDETMMQMRTSVFVVFSLVLAGCSSSNTSSPRTGSCDGTEIVCPSMAYGLCTGVQQSPGVCVNWSTIGASSCKVPSDCPTSLPAGTFSSAAGAATPMCVKATTVEYSDTGASADIGYCAAMQVATDATGAATCTPNPCGTKGYCSYVRNGAGSSYVTCTWPI